jgi:hypothetical protein
MKKQSLEQGVRQSIELSALFQVLATKGVDHQPRQPLLTGWEVHKRGVRLDVAKPQVQDE